MRRTDVVRVKQIFHSACREIDALREPELRGAESAETHGRRATAVRKRRVADELGRMSDVLFAMGESEETRLLLVLAAPVLVEEEESCDPKT